MSESIVVTSNGSKWYGEQPDSPEQLLQVLAENPLDPTFELYGNFVFDEGERVRVWGNFLELSHAFDLHGPRKQMQPLIDAIRANQATPNYIHARERANVEAQLATSAD